MRYRDFAGSYSSFSARVMSPVSNEWRDNLSNNRLLGYHTRYRRKTELLFTELKRKERICGSNACKLFVALQTDIAACWRRLII